ncbi:MAG: LLM class flavin-dependent oxidoreductase [Proteobacteria bacterium]|nr:LLM class flavin-dependent oxidoreductase [Pseudomonadota bacterium]MDA1299789.1 LLM class flavin-dependent oxidoreductase [Pseudomonadota bacterium]
MQVAVTAWKFGTRGLAHELASQAELAEAIGFDSFWLPESHFGGSGSIPSPLMLLASVASRTTRIRLGTTSYLLPIRHPIQAAEDVAVLDTMSGGRVILGVGRGFQDSMFSAFDVPIKDKRRRFKANLALMINAWSGEPIALDQQGEPIRLAPLPVQKPHPPIWVAAFGPLAIKQAGSLGLPYIASPRETLDVLVANYEQHARHASEAGHEPIKVRPVMRTVLISERTSLIREVRRILAADPEGSPEQRAIVGDTAYACDKIAEYQERLGMNYLIARGRIQGVDNAEQVSSHEALAKLTNQ